jgi:hypothetical protein
MTADYAEQTDAQKVSLSGTNRALAYRSTEAISFVDLGLEWGTYAVSGQSSLHEVEVSSDYVNLLVGLTFRLFPGWIQYSLDYGYRLGVDRVKLDRTTSSGKVDRHKIGGFSEQPFTRFGVRFLLGQNLFVGFSTEQQSQLFDKSKDSMYPSANSANSTVLILGYRFGGRGAGGGVLPKVRSGNLNYNDPCITHLLCDPS